jgi:hypothetical protein
MSETTNEIDRLKELMRVRFGALRSRMADMEAIAHAAAESTTALPYPRQATQEEKRVVRRMHSLVLVTANEAESVLHAMDSLIVQIESVMQGPDDDNNDDDESGDQEPPTVQ